MPASIENLPSDGSLFYHQHNPFERPIVRSTAGDASGDGPARDIRIVYSPASSWSVFAR
jgi:hypothetical protein